MAITDIASNWDKIRQGVRDAETLLGQKKYNLALMKCRQVVEFMVRSQCEKARILEPDLSSSIDGLYNGRFITKTTCEHYHKIRMLGNRAVHEGSDNAYDANQAFQLLQQEVHTFFGGPREPARQEPARRRPPAAPTRTSSDSKKSRRRQPQKGGLPFSSADLMRGVIVILGIILLFALIKLIIPDKKENTETTPAVTTEASVPETSTEPETMAETTPAPVYRVSADALNVRSEPSTDGEKIGSLTDGTVVDYVGEYDADWAIILYEGNEAYVASQYLVHD